jgi:ATP-dependent 26S proteasome regulatory subunit
MRNTGTSGLPTTFEGMLDLYINRLKENKEMEARLKSVRVEYNAMNTESTKLEENLKAIQNSGQLIGEILKKIDNEKSKLIFIFYSEVNFCL